MTCYTLIDSPVGDIMLVGETVDGFALTGVYMVGQRHERPIGADWLRDPIPFKPAEEQLDAYFAGELTSFDVPISLRGSEFQRSVWKGLLDIDYGTTCAYGVLAARVADRAKTRAVAAAVGRNPLGIVVPCHRVIGANGSLTGYAGGLERKRWLLDLEAKVVGATLPLVAGPSAKRLG